MLGIKLATFLPTACIKDDTDLSLFFPSLNRQTCFLDFFLLVHFHNLDHRVFGLKNKDQRISYKLFVPVMVAVAMRKKVVSIGLFSPGFCFQSLQFLLFVRSN